MSKNDTKKKSAVEQADESSDEKIAEKEEVILPRKRKIVKNKQLTIVISILLVSLITAITWRLFFYHSVVGQWFYINNGEYTETYDVANETDDVPDEVKHTYTQRVCYEFKDNGECIVTLGTMSVKGQYTLYSTDAAYSMITASVAYQNTPVFYGSYNYKIKGNVFTGEKLIISSESTDETIELEEGMGDSPLKIRDDFKGDDRFDGTWRDDLEGVDYKFTPDGYFTRISDDGLTIEHTYTVIDDGVIMATYYGDYEQNYSYTYEFDNDNNLIFNETYLKKIK